MCQSLAFSERGQLLQLHVERTLLEARKPHPKLRNTPKNASMRTFSKSSGELLPASPSRNCSENLFRCTFSFWVDFGGWISSSELHQPSRNERKLRDLNRGNQSIYLHRSGPLLENSLDRPKNCYGRYGLPSFYSISISTVGLDGARVCL